MRSVSGGFIKPTVWSKELREDFLAQPAKLRPLGVRPRWYSQLGLVACAVFYLGLALLVFISTQLPMLREMLR